jgi:hypothetical protein
MTECGKRTAVSVGFLALGAVLATGAVFHGTLFEAWNLLQLSSRDLNARQAALAWLVDRASLRAVPVLLRSRSWVSETPWLLESDAALIQICCARKAESVPLLTRHLKDPDVIVRRLAVVALCQVCQETRAGLSELAGALADLDYMVRFNASYVLESIGEPAVPAPIGAPSGLDPALRRIGEER